MEQTYIIRDPDKGIFAAAIADVVEMPTGKDRHYVITRINVMDQYRGRGYGSKILNMILEDADNEGATLFLEPVPSGPLDAEALKEWYSRSGFEWGAWHMRRKPRR